MLDEGLTQCRALRHGLVAVLCQVVARLEEARQPAAPASPRDLRGGGGDPNIAYYHSYWELGEDECLEVTFTPPKCQYWNFQLNNYWIESLDYRYFQITLNKHSAECRPDGSVRILVAHKDPGLGNWIDTAYHRCGTMCLRWVRSANSPRVQVRKLKSAELQQICPDEDPALSPAHPSVQPKPVFRQNWRKVP
jgi:hypothetical protein